jgi:hypothetical protein
MDVTRQSLLIRAREGDQGAWDDIHTLYRRLIVGWLHRQAAADRDLDDLVHAGDDGDQVRAGHQAGVPPDGARGSHRRRGGPRARAFVRDRLSFGQVAIN